jgi:cobalamin biosynthesis protein CbiD
MQHPQTQQYQQQPPPQRMQHPQKQPPSHKVSFVEEPDPPVQKISISDAIGYITIRLSGLESKLMQLSSSSFSSSSSSSSQDTSVLATFANRLDSLEKSQTNKENDKEMLEIREMLEKMGTLISRQDVKSLQLERELTSVKDTLKTFIMKYDSFVEETQSRFNVFENAFTELESQIEKTNTDALIPELSILAPPLSNETTLLNLETVEVNNGIPQLSLS